MCVILAWHERALARDGVETNPCAVLCSVPYLFRTVLEIALSLKPVIERGSVTAPLFRDNSLILMLLIKSAS